jgi:hypothetical protein
MTSRKRREPPQRGAEVIRHPAARRAFARRSLRDRLADIEFESESRELVEEADRLLRKSASLLRMAESTNRRLKRLVGEE